MRGKTSGRFFQGTSRGLTVALVLIAVAVPIRTFANDPSAASEEQKQTQPRRCKFLMEKAARELQEIAQVLEGRDWVQRKKLKEITNRIEEISEELERSWKETKSGVFESVAPPNH
jgi:hypothetical protein